MQLQSTAEEEPVRVLERLEDWGAERGWVGPDPYEGLSTALGELTWSRRPRQAVIQAYKRLPARPPWPLRAAPTPNAKALGLALSGYSTPIGRRLRRADRFLSELPASLARLDLFSEGSAWGYPFDVQTRSIRYDRSTPNAIATCFVLGGLLDAYEATGEERHAESALAARPFLVSLLSRSTGHGPYFAYVAAGSALIHNANMLAGGALARLNELESDEVARAAVLDAAATTIGLQRDDGLWLYGESPSLAWIDGFHTAYTLEGLRCVSSAFGIGDDALDLGIRGWRAQLIDEAGWARTYPTRRFPLEAKCCAAAIDLLCAVAPRPGISDAGELAGRVAAVAIRELWLPGEGRFAYRRSRHWRNRREFMRWTNAPMFRALSALASLQER